MKQKSIKPSSIKNKSFLVTWNKGQITILGLILGIGSVLSIFYIDQPLTLWLHNMFQGRLDSVAKIFTWFGSGDTYFLISVFGYLIVRLFSEKLTHQSLQKRLEEAKERFKFMFLCFLVSGLFVLILKILFGRSRPYNSLDFSPINFQPITLDWNFQSYPSGHTQVGFTLASFISIIYPKLTVYIFTFATLVGISRIVLEKHYLGDVLAGAVIGISGTYITLNWKGKKFLE